LISSLMNLAVFSPGSMFIAAVAKTLPTD